jgi:hypothetical protein
MALPIPRTAEALITNSPSDNLAGMESDISVPGPDTKPPSAFPFFFLSSSFFFVKSS